MQLHAHTQSPAYARTSNLARIIINERYIIDDYEPGTSIELAFLIVNQGARRMIFKLKPRCDERETVIIYAQFMRD